tara:strand:- start:2239 stop:2607 length:369 start_codon:yes stop_codon:yes gene_type:complete
MAKSSKQIQNFLTAVGADPARDVQLVPKSDSCADPGDVVFFRYKLGTGRGSRAERLLLVTKPVTRDAATGNQLLTGFKLPADGDYTPESLDTLYTQGDLGEDDFRTYIMTNIFGQLKRIRKQ